jgi:hypothetical protein
VYVFEFKIAETAQKAVQQIDNKGYTIPYTAKGKKIVKIGVAFSKKKRGITDWKQERVGSENERVSIVKR